MNIVKLLENVKKRKLTAKERIAVIDYGTWLAEYTNMTTAQLEELTDAKLVNIVHDAMCDYTNSIS
jgi:hypothetical protein